MKVFNACIAGALGHGRLMEPPARTSYALHMNDPAIAADADKITFLYDDNALFCGGTSHQISQGYKCGKCGDAYDLPRPRDYEWGGRYGRSGIIPRVYSMGSEIELTVQVTAHHMGWFEYSLCKMSENDITEPESCFENPEDLLVFDDGTTRWDIPGTNVGGDPVKGGWWYTRMARLPEGLTCDHCVIQWRYHTGNSWGCDHKTNVCGMGEGYQEEFYGCADVQIIEGPVEEPEEEKGLDVALYCSEVGAGIHPHPEFCDAYVECSGFANSVLHCAPGLNFNKKVSACDWAANVDCNV